MNKRTMNRLLEGQERFLKLFENILEKN
jgi:hypothetical protein